MAFEQFSDIAIWILMCYLVVNASVSYFNSSTTFQQNNLVASGVTQDTRYLTDANIGKSVNFLGTNLDCSPASPNALTAGPCFLAQATDGFTRIIQGFVGFLTNWINLLNVILPNWIPGAPLIKTILIPILVLIEVIALFVVVIQIAGIAGIIFKSVI